MLEKYKTDIFSLVDDYNRECDNSTLDEVSEYVTGILPLIGYAKKYVFDRSIRQQIAELFPDIYGEHYNDFIIEDKPEVVEFLKTLPQNEQRTEAWYNDRINSLGASESSAIFGLNPYENEKKLILKKCGVKNDSDMKRMKAVCEHGIKYEQVIQEMYCRYNNTTIIEFGSIRHQDKDLSIITASPDGITPNGCMLEIKAPAKRIITGIPPSYYWVQCQQQMQVCNLDKVDFLEVKIEEYSNIHDYMSDFKEDSNEPHTSEGLDKGVVIEYHKLGLDGELGYIYPDKLLLTDELKTWKAETIKQLEKSEDKQFRRISYWRCRQYCLTGIYRDDEWWNTNLHKFKLFWDKVLIHRKEGFQELLPKPSLKKYKKKEIECEIISDDDTKTEVYCVNNETCLIDSDEN